jgi:hypothetical protein
VASPKDTFAILTDDQVNAKAADLIAETQTDAEGRFSFTLDEKNRYAGEAFEVDFVCGTVPPKPRPNPPPPLQISITTVQPLWRKTEAGLVAVWEYCLPARYWCAVLARLGLWVICGQVTMCDTKQPVGGLKVFAFDADWTQDDPLGSAVTDSAGKFRITYLTEDFQKTPFSPLINIEWIGGPDVYFRVETGTAVPVLVEPRSRARQPDRENIGNCFCVQLCIPEQPPVTTDPLPVFTAIGGYQFLTDIHSTPPGTGLTVGDHRAFYATLRLNGILPKKLNNQPMEYRFEVRRTDAVGNPTSGWTPIASGQITRTVIGLWQKYAPAFPGDPNPVKTKLYTVNGVPGPNELVASFTPDGWIRVPQESNVFGPEGFFQPNGNMIALISQTLAAFGAVDQTGVMAGFSSTSGGEALAQNRHFSLRMRVREQGNLGAGVDAGVCEHVAIDNTLYNNVSHHPAWAGYVQSGALGVALLDIKQLTTNGCAGITNALDVLFTAAHPDLGGVSISMIGPGGPYGFTLPAAVPGEQFGTATPNFNVAALQACAYIVTLSVQLLLTTGDSIPDNLYDQVAFCKS